MSWLRRSLILFGVCAGALVYAIFSWGVFPRNLIGVGLLILVGAPLALAGEALAEVAFYRKTHRPMVRVAALIGLALLLGSAWWILSSDLVHMRQYLHAGA